MGDLERIYQDLKVAEEYRPIRRHRINRMTATGTPWRTEVLGVT